MSFFGNRQLQFRWEAFYPAENEWRSITETLAAARVNLGDVSAIGTGALGGDGVVRIASFTAKNNRPTTGDIHPRDQSSAWNRNPWTGEYDALFRPNRRVRLLVGFAAPLLTGVPLTDPKDDAELEDPNDNSVITDPQGAKLYPAPLEWHALFDGFLGDEISGSEPELTLTARDHAKFLQMMFFEGGFVSSPGLPSQVLQDLINTIMPPAHRPIVHVVGVEEFNMLGGWQPENTTVWEAAQEIAGSMGWALSFEFNGIEPILVLREPPRGASVADHALTGDDLLANNLALSDSDVRNRVAVDYFDEASEGMERVVVEDSESVALLTGGVPVLAVLGSPLTDLVSSGAHAVALAEAALNDLSDIYEVVTAETPLFPELGLFNILSLQTPLLSGYGVVNIVSDDESLNIVSDDESLNIIGVVADNVGYSVASIQHSISMGSSARFRTSFTATGRVIGRRNWWLDRSL